MSGTSINKNRNKRWDRLATHVFLFSAKNQIYIQNTHAHIHIQSAAENSLFQFYSPLQNRLLRSMSRKRLTLEVSKLDELMVLSIHAPLVS